MLVTCSYKEREFIRVGYYVNNELPCANPEEPPVFEPSKLPLVQRQILADKPRVTKFPIPWGQENAEPQQQQVPKMQAMATEMPAEMEVE